jgi:hypothetical protein
MFPYVTSCISGYTVSTVVSEETEKDLDRSDHDLLLLLLLHQALQLSMFDSFGLLNYFLPLNLIMDSFFAQ